MFKTNAPVHTNRGTASRRGVRRPSEYGTKLQEKQKVKDVYELREAALRNYLAKFQRRHKSKGESLNGSFLAYLEQRLDNVLYRLGAGVSRRAARQCVAHGKVKVNGRRVTLPSYWLRVGDQLDLKGVIFSEEGVVPAWLKLDKKRGKAVVVRLPNSNEVEPDIDEKTVFEYYSKW